MERGSSRPAVLGWAMLLALFGVSAVLSHPSRSELVDLLTRAIEQRPDDPALYLGRARALVSSGDPAAALEDAATARRLGGGGVEAEVVEGLAHRLAGRRWAAEEAFSRALELEPDRLQTLRLRAVVRRELGRHGAAAEDLTRLLSLSSSAAPELHLELVRALRQAGRLEEALRSVERSLETLGSQTSLRREWLAVTVELGDLERGRDRLCAWAAADRHPARWWLFWGELLEEAGRPQEARAGYLEARRLLLAAADDERGGGREATAYRRWSEQAAAGLQRTFRASARAQGGG